MPVQNSIMDTADSFHAYQSPCSSNASQQPFQDVPVTEQGVDTAAFLEACEDVVKMFGGVYFLINCHRIAC